MITFLTIWGLLGFIFICLFIAGGGREWIVNLDPRQKTYLTLALGPIVWVIVAIVFLLT